jgi:hypothetical protein
LVKTSGCASDKFLQGRFDFDRIGRISEAREHCPEAVRSFVTASCRGCEVVAVMQELGERGDHQRSDCGAFECSDAFLARWTQVQLFAGLLR